MPPLFNCWHPLPPGTYCHLDLGSVTPLCMIVNICPLSLISNLKHNNSVSRNIIQHFSVFFGPPTYHTINPVSITQLIFSGKLKKLMMVMMMMMVMMIMTVMVKMKFTYHTINPVSITQLSGKLKQTR